jgi:ketosteroid isomerase-like protein
MAADRRLSRECDNTRFIHPEVQGMTSITKHMTAALTLIGAVAVVAPAAAGEPETEVRELFAAHEQAVNGHDIKALMALYAPGDETVVMGTTPPERWVGETEIADAYGHIFEDFDAGTVQRDCPWMQIGTSGEAAWITANCEYQDSLDGKARSFALNLTGVLEKLDGAWKLRTMHFSNPTAP